MKRIIISIAIVVMAAAASFSAKAEGLVIKGGFSYTHLDLTQSIKDQAQQLAVNARNFPITREIFFGLIFLMPTFIAPCGSRSCRRCGLWRELI